jgi:hypothetical protein
MLTGVEKIAAKAREDTPGGRLKPSYSTKKRGLQKRICLVISVNSYTIFL